MGAPESLLYGLSVALRFENFLAAVAGAVLGTLVGVLPGIGPLGAMALLLPATLALRPDAALIMLAAIYYGSMYGGSTTSILVNVPGETASVVTAIDGYQMAKKGRAGAALAVAAVGSFVAGTLGAAALLLFAPRLAALALAFGPPEYFVITFAGLVLLSQLSGGSPWKALFVLSFGLALGTIGMEPISGVRRYTFGSLALAQGIELVPVAMGLFGLAEVLLVAERAGGLPQIQKVRLPDLFPTRSEWCRAVPAILRGVAVGFPLGLVPGPAPVLASFASYALERRVSRRPQEFGNGAIEGVAGPEAANNAATTGALVPLLALGIPFAPAVALLLSALMIHGVQPGPLLMREHPEVFWGLLASLYVGNLALLLLNMPLIGVWVSVLRIPEPALIATILILMLVGAYSVNNSLYDLLVLVGMGLIGYALRKLGFDVTPIILGLVLGPTVERTFRQSLYMSAGDLLVFVRRPVSAGILLLALLTVVAIWLARRHSRASGRSEVPGD